MDIREFEELVYDALEGLPDWFKEKVENVDVVVEDEPSPELLRDMGIGRRGTLLGLYQGIPLTRRGFYYGNVLPDKITLYMGPILRQSGGRDDIEARIREVVVHEVGHYFGLSDARMRELEREGPSH
ncbi:MAG: metallopeptidase family protein [Nitrospirae bacterium]|nr:metallopeptidase family protein [Nitrospirota bacterium]